MDFQNPDILRNALKNQNLQVAMRCIKAGQNPIHLRDPNGKYSFFFSAIQEDDIKPEYLSFIALHRIINFNDVKIPESHSMSTMTPLMCLVTYFNVKKIKKLHLLLETGLDVNHGCLRGTNGFGNRNIFEWLGRGIDPIAATMLLFAGGNAVNKSNVPFETKRTVKIWLDGFAQAKKMFIQIFDDKDLESLLATFVFNEDYLRIAVE